MIQHDEEAVVSHARARTLAECWQDDQDGGSPLSVLAETGAISDATVWALRSDLQRLERALEDSEVEEPMSSRGQLRALLRYVTACGERGPVPGWTGLTDRDIYSDHSVPVRRAPAAAPARARADDRVVPFPAHRARSVEEAVPLASRRLRAADDAPPVRRAAAAPARSRTDDRVVPFPAHRARSAEEVIPLASRRLRAADDAPPVRRPREEPAEIADTTPSAARRVRYRDEVAVPAPARPRARDARDDDEVAQPRPRYRYETEVSGFGPAEVSRPEERARQQRDSAPTSYPEDDEVVYSALDGPYGDVDWTG